jgi:type IV pilus assembly protein PilF
MDTYKRAIILVLLSLVIAGCKKEQLEEIDNTTNNATKAAAFNVRLGLGYLQHGDMQRAKRKLVTAMKQNPNSPDVNDAMAYFLESTKQFSQAENYYKKAMKLAPGNGAQLNNYGAFLCRQGKYKQAESYFISATNDQSYINSAGAYENAGICALMIPDIKHAKNYFIKAIAQDPKRPKSLFELAKIEIKQKNGKAAVNYIKQYEMFFPQTGQLVAMAREAYVLSGRQDIAVEYVDKMKKNYPDEYKKWLASTKHHDKQHSRVS